MLLFSFAFGVSLTLLCFASTKYRLFNPFYLAFQIVVSPSLAFSSQLFSFLSPRHRDLHHLHRLPTLIISLYTDVPSKSTETDMPHDSLESQASTTEKEKEIVKDIMARGEEGMKRSSMNAPDWWVFSPIPFFVP